MKRSVLFKMIGVGLSVIAAMTAGYSQSTSQNFPTPVTTNEVSGEIKARDIGDPRLTTYFYTFDGSQGDMFVNVVSKNFNGDIDIFIADGLKPLSKIVVYADTSEVETGRVIYLRQPAKIILRVEGRTPNDDAAMFKLKFAGSFVASTATNEQEPELPGIKDANNSRTKVNSVGTVIERIPKRNRPKPVAVMPPSVTKADEKIAEKPPDKNAENSSEAKADKRVEDENVQPKSDVKKVEVVVSDNMPPSTEPVETKKPATARTRKTAPVKKEKTTVPKSDQSTGEPGSEPAKTEPAKVTTKRSNSRVAKTTPPPKSAAPDPLENIHLVILFKDGTKIEMAMSDVLRFSADRGILTVISKNGTIGRYAMTDVLKTTIE